MKTAILIALSADKREGSPVSEVMPYDQAVAKFKALVNGGTWNDPKLPVLQVWSSATAVKTHRFKVGVVVPVDSAEEADDGPTDEEIAQAQAARAEIPLDGVAPDGAAAVPAKAKKAA